MKRFKTELKKTTIPWLDKIPSHWSVAPIKYLATEKNSYFNDGDWIESKDIQSTGISYLTTGNIGPGFFKTKDANYISEDTFHSLNCSQVFPGDILISRLNSPVGRACIVPKLEDQLVTSVDNVIFRPDTKLNRVFFVFLSSSKEYFKHTGDLARGTTMQRISRSILGSIRIPLPPAGEQQKIAQFLDYETAKIDALIDEQRRLIELLKEKRQAVISHAVTKGLNQDAPMKDSGVEWLGEVPEHWEVNRLKLLTASIKAGPFGSALKKDSYVKAGYKVYGQEQVIKNDFSFGDYYISEEFFHHMEQYSVRTHDVLISCVGTFGKIAIVPSTAEEGIINPRLIRLRLKKHLQPKFIRDVLKSQVTFEQFNMFSRGGTMDVINIGTLAEVWLPIPPQEEQKRISDWLESTISKFDNLTNEAQSQIDLLHERRSALISAAVTGKIDVRDWQPPAGSDTVDSNASVQTERHYG